MFLTENNVMKKILPGILLLVLTGCVADTSSETGITAETKGVYYPAISEKELKAVYSDMASYAYTLLRYDDEVYTSFYWNTLPDNAEIPPTSVAGKEIGTVYGNHEVFWSMDEKDLSDSTLTASVYSVNGYDEDFRICIYYQKAWPMTGYGVQIFEKLNNITLFQGSELYKDRLHLDQAAAVYDADNRSISLTMPPMAEFMEALFDGQFVEADSKICSALGHSDAQSIYFEDDLGFVTQIEVYPKGYVLMRRHEDLFIVQLEPEICLKITDMNLEQ